MVVRLAFSFLEIENDLIVLDFFVIKLSLQAHKATYLSISRHRYYFQIVKIVFFLA
jgi:hypothetical protein